VALKSGEAQTSAAQSVFAGTNLVGSVIDAALVDLVQTLSVTQYQDLTSKMLPTLTKIKPENGLKSLETLK
jgi:hypothetical protein